MEGRQSVSVQVFVEIGSKYEEREVWGISHFLEHMAFKGTKKRPSAMEIEKEIDSLGAGRNAGTSHEYTNYWIKVAAEHTGWALEILADMLLNPVFPEREIEKEKGVVIEEINMYEDNPMMSLPHDFFELMYRDGEVGCWSVIGTKKTVGGISRKGLYDYRKRFFGGNKTVVVVAGRVDQVGQVEEWVRQYFEKVPSGKVKLPEVPVILDKKQEDRRDKGLDQAHFALGLPTVSWRDERRWADRLWDVILAGNTSSRLWQKIRQDRGLAYYVFSVSEDLREAGYVAVQAGVKKEKLEEAIKVCKSEILGFAKTVTEEELERAKRYVQGKTKLSMEKTDFWASFVGRKLLLEGELVGVEEELAKFEAVTLKELKSLVAEKAKREEFRLAVRQ